VIEDTNTEVALKFLLREKLEYLRDQAKQVRSEIQGMIRVDNPHVIKLLDYNLDCKYPDKSGKLLNTILLVLEYCPGGDLFDILYYTKRFDPRTARTYFVQMMQGLKACHDAGIVHRDLKPQNLLLDANFQLKIADFGLSFIPQLCVNGLPRGTCGTRGYQAPELLKGKKHTKACDIFSCGVIMFILITGHPPFKEARRDDPIYKYLCESNTGAFWKIHRSVEIDDYCKDLITGMLAYRARKRFSVNDCFQHKWIVGRKVHTKAQLQTLVKKKHRLAIQLRMKDKHKMRELDYSVKVRKRRSIWNNTDKKIATEFQEVQGQDFNVEPYLSKLPVTDNFFPFLMTFYAEKSLLNQA